MIKVRHAEGYGAHISSVKEIAEKVNSVYFSTLATLQNRFVSAINSDTKYTLIVSGDSTRDAPNGRAMPYYNEQLAKINFNVVDNSTSGQSVNNWINNIGNTTLQQAIDATPSNGGETLLEFSMALNDYTDGSPANVAAIKADILTGLNAYMTAKPDAIIYLVSPPRTYRGDVFEGMYQEIANELGVVWVSGYQAMGVTYPDPEWYADTTHPNWYGSMRLVNYIFNAILPSTAKQYMWITDNPALGQALPTLGVESGFWITSTGGSASDTNWRRTVRISVDPSSVLTVVHQGNRTDCLMYDKDGNFIKNTQKLVDIYLTPETFFVAFNITSDQSTWTPLGDTPSVVYSNTIYTYIKQSEINEGNAIGIPYKRTYLVDKNGLTGTSGQAPISDGANDWVWGTA